VTPGVLDAGVAIGWIQGRHRSAAKLQRLFTSARDGDVSLMMSIVSLAEVLKHTADVTRATGADVVALLSAHGIRFHQPDEAVARRVARLSTSLADGFAAATALELRGRLHTTDGDLVERLQGVKLAITRY
jgi:predicted nucleic acid-binding protein